MDTNLYIEGLPEEKQPGTHVRRVNGKRLNDDEMIKHYTNLVKLYGIDGKLTCRWVYGMAVINNGKESTYTWSKEDFYMVDKPSDKMNTGYPLNTLSVNKKPTFIAPFFWGICCQPNPFFLFGLKSAFAEIALR